MKSPEVQLFCRMLWHRRALGALPEVGHLSRLLATSVAADVAAHRRYDPECDNRVFWAREILRQLRERPKATPRASGDLEATAMWLLDLEPKPAGRALAAKED